MGARDHCDAGLTSGSLPPRSFRLNIARNGHHGEEAKDEDGRDLEHAEDQDPRPADVVEDESLGCGYEVSA